MSGLIAPEPRVPVRPGRVPTFSVVIAAYQAERTIAGAVESALAQTLPPLEVILCDDGSSDDLAGALAPFGDRVRLLRQEHRGPGAAKRTASETASGDFVAILDADDAYEPRRLEALGEAAASRPDLDLLTTDALYELDGAVLRRCYEDPAEFPTESQRSEILRRNFVFGAAAIRRARLEELGGFDASLAELDDWDLWIRLLLAGGAAGLVHEPLYRYRLHPESLSAARLRDLRARVRLLASVRSSPDLRAEERPVLERSLTQTGGELLRAEAEEALLHAGPGRRRALAALATSPGVRTRTRLTAIVALAAPSLAARRLRRLRQGRPLLY